jgi:solute carrier family 35 (adenosine 3'-phospho 5'-phosphosulfate transporter), member B3
MVQATHNNGNAHNGLYTRQALFDTLSPTVQFAVLASGVMVFFGAHNYLQEAIMSVDGFHLGVMLGYMEVLGVALCSLGERTVLIHREQRAMTKQSSSATNGHHHVPSAARRVAPMSAYPLLMACLMTSSALSNMSLNYINFPTKVVFRSCKLIPTMLVASIVHKKVFSVSEYCCALAVCLGLVLFAAADWDLSPSFHPIGLIMVTLSVCADAILPNAQEKLFHMGASRLEVTLYTNCYTLLAMTVSTLLSGDLLGAWELTLRSRQLQIYFLIYTFVAYIAISTHMMVVKRFGGVAAVLLATVRKGMTLVLSFILFPKGFSWFYPVGATLVLGGLLASSLIRIYSKKKPSANSSASPTAAENSQLELKQRMNHKVLKQHLSDVEAQPLIDPSHRA